MMHSCEMLRGISAGELVWKNRAMWLPVFHPAISSVVRLRSIVEVEAMSWLCWLVFGIFLAQLIWAINRVLRAWHTTRWTIAMGVIDSVSILEAPRSRKYEVQVTYRFVWEGQECVGDRCTWMPSTGSWEVCLDLAKIYEEGVTVPVYVNPADPRQSVLRPGVGYQDVLVAVLLIATCVNIGLASWMVS